MANLCAARVCAFGILIAGTQPSLAAEPESAAADTEQTRQLGAIKVYSDEEGPSYTAPDAASATGLNLSLRDTPQPVTVITRERIEDQAMENLFDVLRSSTGVSVQAVDRGRSTLRVRGFEVNNFQFDGIPTSLYIDNNPATALFERVEIVRGATGLLNGAGDPSATVNLVRKAAASRDLAGDFAAEMGSWNQVTATADLSTPLNSTGSVRARWVAHYNDQDAFLDHEHTRTTAFYGVVEADLGERTLLRVGATDQSDRRDGVLWAGLPYWYADGTRTDWSRSRSTATDWNQWDVDDRNYFAGLTHTFGNEWTLRANASYTTNDDEERMLWMWNVPDRETGLGMEAYPYHYLGGFDQHHFDLIASGPFEAWGRQHEITVGIMHSKLDEVWSNRDAVEPVPSFPVGDFNAWDGSFAEPELGARYEASRYVTTETAAYAAARLQVTEPLKLIVGARVENWEMDAGARVWVPEAFTITHDGIVIPYAGIIYDLGERYSLYGSYTSIFKHQEYRDRNGDFLDPVEGNSFEVGIKAEFFDGKLNASAGVFRVDQDNVGVEDVGFFVPPANIEPAYRAAQGVEADGYELELAGQITPAWDVSLGWTHFSARDADGNDVAIDDPRKQLKLFTKYQFSGAAQGLSIGGGVNWSGPQPARAINPSTEEEELIGQRAYAVVDLLARYQVSEQLSAQLNVENALDEEYVSRNTGWWGGPFVWGAPRSFRASVSYSFN
jgi:outer membrane receptor for ferric coprogen and ferric-rhodotorulic acid